MFKDANKKFNLDISKYYIRWLFEIKNGEMVWLLLNVAFIIS